MTRKRPLSPAELARCGGCDHRWPAQSNRAHCAAEGCHQTFSGPSLFDRHRVGFQCVPPGSITSKAGNPVMTLVGTDWVSWVDPTTEPREWWPS